MCRDAVSRTRHGTAQCACFVAGVFGLLRKVLQIENLVGVHERMLSVADFCGLSTLVRQFSL